jgi:glycosyltransferase involved in cell wall biosynthesis
MRERGVDVRRPLVSVVIPVYNGERFVAEALESFAAQDYRPLETIVVDDGSTDRSAEIAGAYPEVQLIRQPNRGPAAARNAGMSVARGPFIAFHDADDLVPPTKLTMQVNHLLCHPEIACVLGRQRWLTPPPGVVRDPVYGELDGIPMTSAVFRAEALRAIGGYTEGLRSHENIDLLFRLRESGCGIAVLPDLVLFRRYHGNNASFANWPERDPRLQSLKAKLDRERNRSQPSGL